MIIISLGSILTIVIVIAIGLALLFGLMVVLSGGLSAIIFGTTKVSVGLAGAARAKKFYKECKVQGLGKPESANREKLKLIAQLYNVKNEYDIYLALYKAEHPNEYPEQKKNRVRTIIEKIGKRTIIQYTALYTVAIIIAYFIARALWHYELSGGFIGVWICISIVIGTVMWFIKSTRDTLKPDKDRKKERQRELREKINNMK